jgi:hypothetical protein
MWHDDGSEVEHQLELKRIAMSRGKVQQAPLHGTPDDALKVAKEWFRLYHGEVSRDWTFHHGQPIESAPLLATLILRERAAAVEDAVCSFAPHGIWKELGGVAVSGGANVYQVAEGKS